MCHRRTLTCYNSNRLHMLWCTNTNNILEYLVITLWLLCDYIPLRLFCFIKNIFENILYKVLYKNTLWILIKLSSSGHSVLLKEFFYPRVLLIGLDACGTPRLVLSHVDTRKIGGYSLYPALKIEAIHERAALESLITLSLSQFHEKNWFFCNIFFHFFEFLGFLAWKKYLDMKILKLQLLGP